MYFDYILPTPSESLPLLFLNLFLSIPCSCYDPYFCFKDYGIQFLILKYSWVCIHSLEPGQHTRHPALMSLPLPTSINCSSSSARAGASCSSPPLQFEFVPSATGAGAVDSHQECSDVLENVVTLYSSITTVSYHHDRALA